MQREEKCNHEFEPLGFEIVKKTDKVVETVAAVFCKKCSMFRTKILTFRREFETNGKR